MANRRKYPDHRGLEGPASSSVLWETVGKIENPQFLSVAWVLAEGSQDEIIVAMRVGVSKLAEHLANPDLDAEAVHALMLSLLNKSAAILGKKRAEIATTKGI